MLDRSAKLPAGFDGGTDAFGSRRRQRQEQEKEVQRAARKRAEEEGRGATGPAHDLRDREAETERKRELVSHSGKNGGERGGAGVKQAGAALFGSAKEQKVAVTEKSRAIEQAIQQIEKQFGKGSIMKLGGAGEKIDAISTGSLAVDLALGVGGFPRGRVVEIYGPEASGKTTLALHAVASAQKAGGTAAFIDAEHALDAAWARTCGVSTDDLLISQPDNGQQALEIADTLVRSGAVDIVVIDSVAALVPREEIEGEMGDAHVGLQARLMSQALRKLTGTISKTKTTVIFINQLREKIGIMFGNPETTSGGRALKFYASIRIDIRPIEPIKQGDVVIGRRVKVKVVKNKVAPPFRIAEIEILANEGISREGGLIDMGITTGILDKSGAWINYGKTRIGQGRENAKQFLRDHADVAAEIDTKVRERSLVAGNETSSPNGEES
ncbi:MAG: recombinase RecA [Chloroflexi bacterium]|nr:MAG: recombinase RecA [Chloroflexota bacterium]